MPSKYSHAIQQRVHIPRQRAIGQGAESDYKGTNEFVHAAELISKNIERMRAQKAKDVVANRLYNTQMAPRAGLVTNAAGQGLRIDPKTGKPVQTPFGPGMSGVPTGFNIGKALTQRGIAQGTPFTGGIEELQNRAEAQKLLAETDPVGAAVQKARAAVAASRVTGAPVAGTRAASGTRARGTRAAAGTATAKTPKEKAPTAAQVKAQQAVDDLNYQPNSETDPRNYTRKKFEKDFNHVYGDGAAEKMMPYLGHIQSSHDLVPQTDAKGKALTDANGKQLMGPPRDGLVKDDNNNLTYYEGGVPKYNIGANDIKNVWQGKLNSYLRNAGLEPQTLIPLDSSAGSMAGWTGKKDAQGNLLDNEGKPILNDQGQPLNANIPVGDVRNPAMPKTTFDIASVPDEGWYIDPRTKQLQQMHNPIHQTDVEQSAQREAQQRSLHEEETAPEGSDVFKFDDPDIQRKIDEARERKIYDVAETPSDQAVIDAIQAKQAQGEPSPSDYYMGHRPGQEPVTVTGAGGPPSPSDVYTGSGALAQSTNPSDLYNLPRSYLDQANPQAVAPPASAAESGQAANTASFAPVTDEVLPPVNQDQYRYLGGY